MTPQSRILVEKNHHLHDDHASLTDSSTDSPPKLQHQWGNTHSDEYVEDDKWPTLEIPDRVIYTIIEEDQDNDVDEELFEVYVPDPFGRRNFSASWHQEPESEEVLGDADSIDRADQADELSLSHLNEPEKYGEIIDESDSDDPVKLLNRVLETLREHSIQEFDHEIGSSSEEDY